MAQEKLKLFEKNVLERHKEFYNEHDGVSIANDFLQVSQILEELKTSHQKAFNVLYSVIAENITLKKKLKDKNKIKSQND